MGWVRGLQGLGLLILLIMPAKSWAQIQPDRSLSNPSRTRQERNTTIITGGTQTGENLFHSFRQFSIPNRGVASFRDISPEVRNIFTRVTGRSSSRINGALEALQRDGRLSTANFFLINPNGIHFGRQASLNLGGAFFATTADQIRFANGTEFSAVTPQDAPLLQVSVPIGLQFGSSPALIRNQSRSNLVRDEFGDPSAGGLQVAAGQTIALIGGSIQMDGGYVTAPGGQIEVGSVVTGNVAIAQSDPGWNFDYAAATGGEMNFAQEATLNATDLSGLLAGGRIGLWGDRVRLTGGISILSNTGAAEQNGQDIRIQSRDLELANFSLISTETQGNGNSGNLRIQTDRLWVRSGSAISTQTFGAGNAGDVTLQASQIEFSGRNSVLSTGDFATTGLFAQAGIGSTGAGGTVQITTNQLKLEAGAAIATDTSGSGRAGSIRIQADQVDLTGVLRNAPGNIVLDQGLPFPSGIFADSNPEAAATGTGGEIAIDTRQLRLSDGAVIQTNAEGPGDAGNLTIRATESIELTGRAGPTLPPTTIFAASGGLPGSGGTATATGRGGTLRIQTPRLQLDREAVIAVSSLNPVEQAEGAGSLNLQADQISLSNGSQLSAETASGDGGNLNLQVSDRIKLRNQSRISTTAGTIDAGGDGGNLTIDTQYLFAAPTENSDIRANAFTGTGGTVTITASGIIGIEPRLQPTAFSDITASSELGTAGQVIIRSPDVTPNTTVSNLPTTPLGDRPVQGCAVAQTNSTAEFFTTGRSGLPTTPYEPISNSDILADLRPIDASPSLMEAQSWRTNPQGQIVLMAEAPTSSSHCALH